MLPEPYPSFDNFSCEPMTEIEATSNTATPVLSSDSRTEIEAVSVPKDSQIPVLDVNAEFYDRREFVLERARQKMEALTVKPWQRGYNYKPEPAPRRSRDIFQRC
ncbi:hypothetical protein L596_029057 [Steinernema carpocapsae]|uniref:Uncharacterized protein n=1 Tax=Steinernema carpocapsae TaxID=34508 RepID=A0A4U5LTI1_STECR|nr:hypothetical protein L596_029057 [Steinernema carpocapsae]